MSVPAEVQQAQTLIRNSASYWSEDRQDVARAEMGFAVQQMMRNTYLAKVAAQNPESVYMAMQSVADVGLTLNPAEHQAYLVPRKIGGRVQVCFDPSYQGLLRLATDSGSISWVHADVVYDSEQFEDRGIGEKPVHTKNPFKREGAIQGVYCVAKAGSDYLTATMTREEIDAVRDRSEAWKSYVAKKTHSPGPWGDHYNEMAKKTVLRRAFKTWPRSHTSASLAQAVEISNKNEGWEELPQTSPDLGLVDDSVKVEFDSCIETDNGVGLLKIRSECTEREWTNLYHSFGKGEKGKYQRIVDEMVNNAQAQVLEYQTLLLDYHAQGDELGISEVLGEMSDYERQVVVAGLPNDVALEIGGDSNG